MESRDLTLPLQSHFNFVKWTITSKNVSDEAFEQPLNDFDYSAGEIFYHGLNALYRATEIFKDNSKKFNTFDLPRRSDLTTTEELITLYEDRVNAFAEEVSKFSYQDLDHEIESPLSGKPVILKEWIGQSIMHVIHHVGQAVRIHGMKYRTLQEERVDRVSNQSYQVLYGNAV